jgi:outer membrane lipoprotein-sorting protein
MRKRILAIAAVMMLAFGVFTACGSGDGLRGMESAEELSALEKIHRMFGEMTDFRAIATVEYRSNKGTNTYETIQHGRISGEYRVEVTGPEHVSGSVTASDGQVILQHNSRVPGNAVLQVPEAAERSEIFLTSFIKNYLQCNEISVSVSDMEEGVRTVLEATVPGDHPYLATARLWVDNSTLNPVQLVILDRDGTERIIVTYHVFEKNVGLQDSLFTL